MNGNDEVRILIRAIACCLVDQPEGVNVDLVPQQDGILYRLSVAPTDVGKVIGKQGRTARSIRSILVAAGMKLKRRYSLDIVAEQSN
jgi:predicted RNA-binding protein YlqC (UPF0109 family)